MLRSAFASIPALGLAAALTVSLAATPASAADRIRLVNVNGYSVIDREHLVLNGTGSRHYLVTLDRPCIGLHFGSHVGLSFPSTTTINNPRFEYVTTRDDPRCYIDTIETVESVDAARELIEMRADDSETEDK